MSLRLEILHNSNKILEIACSTEELLIAAADDEDKKEVINCLERSGVLEIEATFMPSTASEAFKNFSTNRPNWDDFTKEINSFNFICVDTNILMNHYCSSFLFRKLGKEQFDRIKFMIPRLSILEIERIANDDTNENKKEHKLRKKRIGLLATSEILFLKTHSAQLLPLSNKTTVTNFLEKAGARKVDAWIRQEVFEFASGQGFPQVLFVTNDIANGLAAFSEGFNTCVFSKIEMDKFFIEWERNNSRSLAEFILNIAVSFEKIVLHAYSNGDRNKYSYEIEGVWTGKTPYHWANRYVRITELK